MSKGHSRSSSAPPTRPATSRVTHSTPVKVDTTAPETAANLDGDQIVVVSLVGSDETSGVASKSYRIAGGAWKTYAGSFTVARSAVAQLVEFRATDKAGNTSAVRGVTIAPAQVVLKPSVTTLTVTPSRVPVGAAAVVAVTVVSAGMLGAELVTVYDGPTLIGAGVLQERQGRHLLRRSGGGQPLVDRPIRRERRSGRVGVGQQGADGGQGHVGRVADRQQDQSVLRRRGAGRP